MSAVTLPLTRRSIFAQAWPIMLGQTTVPLVGVVDTIVIGRTGDAAALAGVALGTTIVSFLFWAFGFLRMGMTGLTAQAQGAGDAGEVRAMLVRGLVLGVLIGLLLFALQLLLIPLMLALFAGGGALDDAAHGFISARFFGAPASLAVFAINGWLLGLGRTRLALLLQIVMNLANIGLDIWFVWGLGWGVRGVGFGTASAEWIALATGLAIAAHVLGPGLLAAIRVDWPNIMARAALRRLFAVNADIMIRTVALLTLFGWFTNAGARLGTDALAANQVLMQFVSVAAFVLDGFCFTAESRVGQAIGARSRGDLIRATRLTGEFALASGLIFALGIAALGIPLIDFMTANQEVRDRAIALLGFVALIPLVGMPAWLLDGVFIGATEGRALRDAGLLSTVLYIGTDLLLRPLDARGVWIAMLAGYAWRALCLGAYFPRLLRRLDVAEPVTGP